MKYIISGGGTGGHIFPAIAIGKAIERLDPDAEILFVGAENRMEMEKVPQAGFNIIGLPVAGFNRSKLHKNFAVILKFIKSLTKAKNIIKDFQPDIAIGVGGYASGPVLKAAQRKGIPTLLQEQNSYAGVTNKMLSEKADAICVAYDDMDRFFPADKIIKTGNPLRPNILEAMTLEKKAAKEKLGFNPAYPLVVVIGGSLGALSVNRAIAASLKSIVDAGASILWQTGKSYYEDFKKEADGFISDRVQIMPFINDMATVYGAADILISRAGASTISEIQCLGIPSVLIPSPNVAEDHQRKNAEALANVDAAIFVPDKDAQTTLTELLPELIKDTERLKRLADNARLMGQKDSDEKIAGIAIEIALKRKAE